MYLERKDTTGQYFTLTLIYLKEMQKCKSDAAFCSAAIFLIIS